MKTLAASLWLARKDLRLWCRDRTGVMLGLLLPIALVSVFGMVMHFAFGGGSGMPRVELWLADADRSPASERFVQALRGVEMLGVRPRAGDAPLAPDVLRQKVVDGEAHHALVVEPGFGAALAEGRDPPLRLVRDPGRTMEGRLVSLALVQATMASTDGQAMATLFAGLMRRQGMDEGDVARLRGGIETAQSLIARMVGGAPPAATQGGDTARVVAPDLGAMFEDLVPVAREDVAPPARPKNLGYQLAQSVAGMTVMMLMFGLMACSVTLLQERDQGTLRRLLVSGAPRHALLLGKFVFCVAIGMLQLVVLFAYGEWLFAVGALRDPLTLLALSLTWAAAATAFGMLIAVWARTAKQAEGLATLLILVMAALGGCWFPLQIADLPWWAEVVTHATITHWAMTGFQALFWQQKGLGDPVVLRAIAVQWGFVVVAGALAFRLWRRRWLAG
jgi:ABC-2 type transport system permease protein